MTSSHLHSKIENLCTLSTKNKRVLINSVLSVVIKGTAAVVGLYMFPAYMRFFAGLPVLGVWFTILSVVSWILNFDLGIGNGLRNHLVAPIVNNDTEAIKKYISSAYITIGCAVIAISCIAYFVFSFINWNVLLNIPERVISRELLIVVTRLTFIGIMLQFLLKLINSILFAMQKSALTSLLGLASSLLLLVFLLTSKAGCSTDNLKMLSLVNIFTTNAPLLVATVILFLTKLRKCAPNLKYYSADSALQIMKLGGIFFWLQIMYMLITNTNEFVISWLVGPEKVVEYLVYNKLFGMFVIIYYIALTPVWSEVTESVAKKEYKWIRKTFIFLIKMTILFLFGEVILVFFLQDIVNLWLRDKAIAVSMFNASIFALSVFLCIINGIISAISNGLGKLKILAIFMTIGAMINIPMAYLLVRITDNWISIVVANVIAMLPYCIVQLIYLNTYLKNKILSHENILISSVV